MSAAAWEHVVTVAVQGTARRQPDLAMLHELTDLPSLLGPEVGTGVGPAPGASGGGGAGAVAEGEQVQQRLLDAAALATAGRRAGLAPGSLTVDPGRPPVEPALPETSTVAREFATWFELLEGAHRRLLVELLLGMRQRRLLFPAPIVPRVLDLGLRDSSPQAAELADLVRATTGERGAWLARQDERWRRYAARLSGSGAGPGDGSPGAPLDDTTWREGDTASRMAWLESLARNDAQAGLAVAAAALTGKGESADIRERVVGVLAGTPLPGDEALLEDALDDRAVGVRRAAARALAGRADTAFQRRMAERSLAWVRMGATPRRLVGGGGPMLVVKAPATLDEAARRDQLATEWHARAVVRGDSARHLHGAVAAAPLSTWAALGHPEGIVRLPVSAGWGRLLRQAWGCRAEIERDRAWAEALLTAPAPVDERGRPETGSATTQSRPGAASVPVDGIETLLSLVSPAVRETALLARLGTAVTDPESAARWLTAAGHPWPSRVLATFAALLEPLSDGSVHHFAHVLSRIAVHEPPEAAVVLAPALQRVSGLRAEKLSRCLDTLRLRAQLQAALEAAARGIPDAATPRDGPTPGPTPPTDVQPHHEGDPP